MALKRFHHADFAPKEFPSSSVCVCLPAREVASTIGPVLHELLPLKNSGVIDQILVVDADSKDGTARIARDAGAEVINEREILRDFGDVIGKGDAMWRALSVITADVTCFVDADSEEFSPHFVSGLIAPILLGEADFAKASYRRPFTVGMTRTPTGGGRVNELLAKPLLRAFYPPLAQFNQPLAGEFAAKTELIKQIPFTTGYGVEIGMLIDVFNHCGIEGMAEVDLDERLNQHQSLQELGKMADQVLAALLQRVEQDGHEIAGADRMPFVSRPPIETLN